VGVPDITEIDFLELLTLEAHGPDTFVGATARYPWGVRLFGGQVVAQALKAAAATVDTARPAHSLHAYFIRPGLARRAGSVRGRASARRSLVQHAAGRGAAVGRGDPEPVGVVPGRRRTKPTSRRSRSPTSPPPDDPSHQDHSWGALIERKAVDFEGGHVGYWIRLNTDLGADPVDAACGLAFMSDAAPSRAARSSHPDFTGGWDDRKAFQGASLDHSMWFHRPCDPTEWHWFDTRSHGLSGGRGLVTGDVMSATGAQVATIAQQVLLRKVRHG
jgi:acyl-CoA thioesterase II